MQIIDAQYEETPEMADDSLDRLSDIDETVAPELRASTTERQRRLSSAAVEWAIEAGHPPRNEVAESARAALIAHQFGESSERESLYLLVEELDTAAWDVQDQVDEGKAPYEDYSLAFRRARAANCLWYALDEDPLEAAGQALYEAYAAAKPGDPGALRRFVDTNG